MDLDELFPAVQYEIHDETDAPLTPEATWDALLAVRMRSLPLSYALNLARHGPAALLGRERWIMPSTTFFEATPIEVVHRDPPHRIVLAGISRPWRLWGDSMAPPSVPVAEFPEWGAAGWVKIGMEFVITGITGITDHSVIHVRTVIATPDPETSRTFARYWRVIKPASWAIRRELLSSLR